MRHEVHSVANGEDRSDVEHRGIGGGRAIFVDGIWSAAENDACGIPFSNPLDASRRRMNLRVHPCLAHTPRDELGELGTIVDDEYS